MSDKTLEVPVTKLQNKISLENIYKAKVRLNQVAIHTPLLFNANLSEKFDCQIFLKREDLQIVRSYKIRGAYNRMVQLNHDERARGIVCSSAGNHAQGVAFACEKLGINGTIFMPTTTPKQKISKVKFFGKNRVEVILSGDVYDASYSAAMAYCETHKKIFVHPFDDPHVIEGQATVGLEIFEDSTSPIDYIFAPVGGGGLSSGIGSCLKQISPNTKLIGVEPIGAPAMYESIKAGKVISLETIDTFVDGVAVKRVGDLCFEICKELLSDIILVPEGKVCGTILQLYNEEALVVEPAGAISVSALDFYADKIKGKNVVCIISGGNNDITRTEEIKERSLLYEGLKHYFIIKFPQRSGALKEFLNNILGENDDITRFEYIKKNSRESGPAIVGIELKDRRDYEPLIKRLSESRFQFQVLNDNPMLFEMLV